jgi:hypothetical protein
MTFKFATDVVILNRIMAKRTLQSAWVECAENAWAMRTFGDFGRRLDKDLDRRDKYYSLLFLIQQTAGRHMQDICDGDFHWRKFPPHTDLMDGHRAMIRLMETVWRESENFGQ